MRTKEERQQDRDNAILQARLILAGEYYVLDTETTGLTEPEACQVAMVHSGGLQFRHYLKPSKKIEAGAIAVHGITNEMVEHEPEANMLLFWLPKEGFLVIYNAPFDIQVIRNTLKARRLALAWPTQTVFDAMQIYSSYIGEWDDYHGNYRWFKLSVACKVCGIDSQDIEFHDALGDCIMTERLLKHIAASKLSSEDK